MSSVSSIQETKFYLPELALNTAVPLTAGLIISAVLPALGKHISRRNTQWKWIVGAATFAINLEIFRRFIPLSTPMSCLTSAVLTVGGHVLANYFITTRRKTYLNNPLKSAPIVLNALFPPELSYIDSYKELFYFYVATKTGFSLILYDSNPAGNLMRNFTHGSDPIGAVVDPMITDVRLRKIPDNLYNQIIHCMYKESGVPSFLALQGIWTSPPAPRQEITEELLFSHLHETSPAATTTGQTTSTFPNILHLLSGQTEYEEYPDFDIQLMRNIWRPMPQTPNLKGFSFKHLDEALIVWVHESNDQALGSDIQATQTESRRLESQINKENGIIEATEQFLRQKMNRDTLLRKLPSARTHNHSQSLIQAIRRAGVTDNIDQQVTQLQTHAKEYLNSLRRRKERADKQLLALQQISSQLQAVQGNESETRRILAENAQKLPTSAAKPTLQVKQTTAVEPEMILYLKRRTLVALIDIFDRYQNQLLPLFSDFDTASNLLAAGKELLKDQALWISQNPRAATVIEMPAFERDIAHFLGDITVPNWKQFGWVRQKLAALNASFEMMGSSEFLVRNVAWLDQAVTHLFNLQQFSGKMDIEFEIEINPLKKQLELLGGDQPLYLTKRLSSEGRFLHGVSTNAQADPLAREDNVHIET